VILLQSCLLLSFQFTVYTTTCCLQFAHQIQKFQAVPSTADTYSQLRPINKLTFQKTRIFKKKSTKINGKRLILQPKSLIWVIDQVEFLFSE